VRYYGNLDTHANLLKKRKKEKEKQKPKEYPAYFKVTIIDHLPSSFSSIINS